MTTASIPLQHGWNVFSLPPGRYKYVVQSPGYQSGSNDFEVRDKEAHPSEVMLDPITSPDFLLDEAASSIPAEMGLLHGFVHDTISGIPLAETLVYLERIGARARTDEKGYFRLYYPVPSVTEYPGIPLPSDNLVFERTGFKTHRVMSVRFYSGTLFFEDLEPGMGQTIRDDANVQPVSPEESEGGDLRSTPSPE